jgi:hypothetical protein
MQLLASFVVDKFVAAEGGGNLLVRVRFEVLTVVRIKITDFKDVYRHISTKLQGVGIIFQKTA